MIIPRSVLFSVDRIIRVRRTPVRARRSYGRNGRGRLKTAAVPLAVPPDTITGGKSSESAVVIDIYTQDAREGPL